MSRREGLYLWEPDISHVFFYFTCVYMQIFNFRDDYVTFWHPSWAYICQMPSHRLSRPAKGTPTELGFPSVTLVWSKTVSCRLYAGQSKGTLKREKCCFSDLAPPTLQNSGIFHDSTRPRLHFDGLFVAEIAAIRRLYIELRVRYKYYNTKTCLVLAWSRPRTDRGLSQPTSVFRTTIVQICVKFYPDRLRFGSTRSKNLFLSKNRARPSLCLGLAVDKGF